MNGTKWNGMNRSITFFAGSIFDVPETLTVETRLPKSTNTSVNDCRFCPRCGKRKDENCGCSMKRYRLTGYKIHFEKITVSAK